jgi:endonuclease/exonuclease/phosphatase family metal-dependent hydrolase
MAKFSLITWNIQWGRGCDGVVDLKRVVATARDLADFDVLCVQELARNFPGLTGRTGDDQPALLARLLPGYTPLFGAATDLQGNGVRRQFGNMILSRLPVAQAFRHLLPWPVDPATPSMQRALVEAVIEAPFGALRVMTTHLEYYSALQRAAQVERIRELHAEAAQRARLERARDTSEGPFLSARRAAAAILTADFNFRPDDPLHDRLAAPYVEGVPAFRDAWQVSHPGVPHPPSLGLFDSIQWPAGPFCCDFVYLTEDLCGRIESVHVDQHTDASDHQPVVLTLRGDLP